ncbi:MAG TPA: hypothetical protein VJC13_02140 [Candidatus Paceibacterota bacterium]
MINRKSTFFLGIFIFLIPFLGLPSSWKTALVVICGLILVFLSVKVILPRKTIANRSRMKKERSIPVFVESLPTYSIDNSETKETQPEIEIK